MSTDIKLDWYSKQGCFDISFTNNDISTDDSITSAIYAQAFTQKKLDDSEQPNAMLQLGWVGNVFYRNGFTLGTKLEGLLNQASITSNTISLIRSEFKIPLEYLRSIGVLVGYSLAVDLSIDSTVKITLEINELADKTTTTEIEVVI